MGNQPDASKRDLLLNIVYGCFFVKHHAMKTLFRRVAEWRGSSTHT